MNFKLKSKISVAFLMITILLPSSILAQKSTAKSKRWHKVNSELILKSETGNNIRKIDLKKNEKTLGVYPEYKFTEKEIVSVKGGVSEDGRFAWTDRRESKWLLSGNKGTNLFRYYNQNGEVLWEKDTVVGATLIQGGDLVGLLETSTTAIQSLEYGNSFARPKIVNSEGELVLDLSECETFSTAVPLSKNQRYGVFRCSDLNPKMKKPFFLLFDIKRKISKKIDSLPQTGIEVRDNGSYVVFKSYQKYDPQTKKYGDFVREIIADGKIE